MITEALVVAPNTGPDFSLDCSHENRIVNTFGYGPILAAMELLGPMTKRYVSKLGLPEKKAMKPKFQKRMSNYYSSTGTYFASSVPEECKKASLALAYICLNRLLDEMQPLSFDILDDAAN